MDEQIFDGEDVEKSGVSTIDLDLEQILNDPDIIITVTFDCDDDMDKIFDNYENN